MKSKSLDFGNLSAPKYKYNKRICMPDPESPELEVCHEVRRTEMTRIFNRFMNDGHKTNKHLKGTQSHESSNLTRDELIGLKSLTILFYEVGGLQLVFIRKSLKA